MLLRLKSIYVKLCWCEREGKTMRRSKRMNGWLYLTRNLAWRYVLTRPWSAPASLPRVLPSHFSPLPWWHWAPGGVEREDTEQGARAGWWRW